MKIKFILIPAVLFIQAVSVLAQLPTTFFANDVFSIQNIAKFNFQNAKLQQNTNENLKTFTGAQISSMSNQLSPEKSTADCGNLNSSLAPEAAPCNGVSVTSVSFIKANRVKESAAIADNTVNVVYRYSNVGTAPDGTALDALVTIINYSNNQDATPTTFRDADLFLNPDTNANVGFDGNLQPSLEPETNTLPNAVSWSGSITYRIQFVRAGTTTPKTISVAATTLDNDGSNICGGLKESVTYSAAANQTLTSNTTNQVRNGNTFTPNSNAIQAGIGTGIDYANAALFVNVTELSWTYSFATSGVCTAGAASEDRFGSLNMSCQINFGKNFAVVGVSGNVYNDTDGLIDNLVDGTGTNAGGLFANLLDGNGNVVSSAPVAAGGTYSFPSVVAGTYNIQISTNQGIESSPAPALALPSGWVSTGEKLGTGTGSDGTVNGLLPLTVAATAIANANFGIEQRPVANNNTAPGQNNPGGNVSVAVPGSVFTTSDATAVSSIRITAFPGNATTITINGTPYTSANFPTGGVTIPIGVGNTPSQPISVDPIDGAVTVVIRYVAIDNAGVVSSPDVSAATVSVPFALAPTAARGEISGTLYFSGKPLRDTLVVLFDASSGAKTVTRTDEQGNYLFDDKEVGKTYIIQPLSSKYAFGSANSVVNLLDSIANVNFDASAKKYQPKNDFDGDGKSDIAVFRPSDGNWYVLKSSDEQMSVFHFGTSTDIPVSADFDGDGKTDYAVFRPSEGNWYVWQSKTQNLRVENFGLADDKLVPSDFDGDGKADVAVYRNGFWYIRRSSDNSFESKNFGLKTDVPVIQDFDGDGKTDFSVYRPSDGNWYSLRSLSSNFSSANFGLSTDVPSAGDFDGDGFADVAQFRNGSWYVLNSTTGFEPVQLGSGKDKSIVGDYDGDGRSDAVTFRNGIWSIRNSGNKNVRKVSFGVVTDILVR